jgi:hypothetical protein
MSKLKAVDPKDAEPSKPKILVYGAPGVGKTWVSMDFPNVYYIDTEGGANLDHYTEKLKAVGGKYFGPEQGALDYDEVIAQIQGLATEKHTYKTVMIDSFTKLYNTYAADIAEKVGDDYGRDKKEANKPTRRLINWLNRVDMNVILICHEKALWGLDASGQRNEIGKTFDGYDKLAYELHLSLNILKTGPKHLAIVRKSRLQGFPDGESFNWSYDDFAKRYGKEVIERSTGVVTLASPEQVAEIKRLLEIVKLPDGYMEKALTKANATDLSEIDAEKANLLIADFKKRLA